MIIQLSAISFLEMEISLFFVDAFESEKVEIKQLFDVLLSKFTSGMDLHRSKILLFIYDFNSHFEHNILFWARHFSRQMNYVHFSRL